MRSGRGRDSLAIWLGVASMATVLSCGPQAAPPADIRPAGDNVLAAPGARPSDLRVAALNTKADFPPIIPSLVPPGPTVIRPPASVSLLSGEVAGMPVRQVQALALSSEQSFAAGVEDSAQRFAFEGIDPWYYRLALVGDDRLLLIRKVVIVEPARPVYLRIEVESGGRTARVDKVSVPVDIQESGEQ